MNSDQLQRIWKTQGQLSVDYDAFLNEVRRNQRALNASVFWRDVREVGASICVVAFFLFWGVADRAWPCFVAALSGIWVGSFMLVDRIRQKRKTPSPGEPLLACIESSVAQVKHQIWLLGNVFWWYLLPVAIGFVFVIGCYAWRIRQSWWLSLTAVVVSLAFCAFACWIIYWMNQRAVEKELRPRQQELESLRGSLQASED
jgi:hypothetical protein